MLENVFERYVKKKYPEIVEMLELAKQEQNIRQKRLEEEMLKFVTAFEKDCEAILDKKLEEKLKEYGITKTMG